MQATERDNYLLPEVIIVFIRFVAGEEASQKIERLLACEIALDHGIGQSSQGRRTAVFVDRWILDHPLDAIHRSIAGAQQQCERDLKMINDDKAPSSHKRRDGAEVVVASNLIILLIITSVFFTDLRACGAEQFEGCS